LDRPLNIYLIRGLTRESGHWGDFLIYLREALPDANIHLLDLPGAGVHVTEKASSNAKKMVDFMRERALSDIQKQDSINIICATSLAGMLATEWVLNHKNDFHGLIMINSSFRGICSMNERVNKAVRGDMLKILLTSNIEYRERLIIRVNSNKPELHDSLTKEWSKIQRERRMTRMNILRQTLAGMRYGTKGRKPEIPLLIIGSKADRMVLPSCIEKMHGFFGGKLVWHPTSGHGLPIDEPEWLSAVISDWCRMDFREQYNAKLKLKE